MSLPRVFLQLPDAEDVFRCLFPPEQQPFDWLQDMVEDKDLRVRHATIGVTEAGSPQQDPHADHWIQSNAVCVCVCAIGSLNSNSVNTLL